MIAWPALDLRGGRAVQLVGGDPARERVGLNDPLAVAHHWANAGFRVLHLVDLDAALRQGSNRSVIEPLLASTSASVQVGGGVRTDEDVSTLLSAGAARVIAGTRALEDRRWLCAASRTWPGRVVVAADTLDGHIVTRGWRTHTPVRTTDFLASLADVALAGVLVTDVGREGSLRGVDAKLFATFAQNTPHPILAAGGVATLVDLRILADAGVAGTVIGMALYTGGVDARAAALEFPA